jgi:hypothetical protein
MWFRRFQAVLRSQFCVALSFQTQHHRLPHSLTPRFLVLLTSSSRWLRRLQTALRSQRRVALSLQTHLYFPTVIKRRSDFSTLLTRVAQMLQTMIPTKSERRSTTSHFSRLVVQLRNAFRLLMIDRRHPQRFAATRLQSSVIFRIT